MHDIRRYPLVSDQVSYQEVSVILRELAAALTKSPGAVVEFGCYTGTTSLFIQRYLYANYEHRPEFHVYDSFAGLPPKTAEDQSPAGEQFKTGELKATKAAFIQHFRHAGLPLPSIHKAWFNDLSSTDVPQNIAFAFLDGDYYESIATSLKLIESKLLPAAIIIVDDYQSEALPGARRAVDEWASKKGLSVRVENSLAIIRTLKAQHNS